MSGPRACSRSVTSGLTRFAPALIAAFLALALSTCGGDGGPSVRLLLEADLSGLPAEADRDAVMTSLADNLERRAIAFGAADVDIQREDSSRVSVTLSGGVISEEDARQLLKQKALLEFRQPILDEEGRVLCRAPDGAQFSISREEITYAPEDADDRLGPRCLGSEGQSGDILWEPAEPTASQGQTEDETTAIIQPIRATVDRTGAPVVVVSFTPDGAALLEEITSRLVGLPLGVFVDGELLAGPTVQEPVTTGNVVIAGLSLPEANILAAQLTAGSLPVPVEEVSAEGTSG